MSSRSPPCAQPGSDTDLDATTEEEEEKEIYIPASEIATTPLEKLVPYIKADDFPSVDATVAILRRDDFPEICERGKPFILHGVDEIMKLQIDVPRKSLLAYAKGRPRLARLLLENDPQADVAELFTEEALAETCREMDSECRKLGERIEKTARQVAKDKKRLRLLSDKYHRLAALVEPEAKPEPQAKPKAKRSRAKPASRRPRSPELLVAKK